MDPPFHTARERIYSPDWRAWRDPAVPESFNPTTYLLDRHAGNPRPALYVDDASYSYGDLLAASCRAAHALTGLGLEPENRILLFGTDSLDYIALWLGAVRAGIVPAVVSDQYKADGLLYFLNDTAAKALFIDDEQLPKLDEIKSRLPASLRHVIRRGDFAKLTEDKPAAFDPVPRHANDMAYMFYSGGTTGTAKGIVHLAHDFVLIPARQGAFWDYAADDVVHATSKKYFTHGLWPGVLIPLSYGATAAISRAPPTPDNICRIVAQRRVTKLITVPTIVKSLMLHAEAAQPDFASVKLVITASEKMPPEIFAKFHATFGVELHDSFGSSEITYERIANRPAEFRRGSLG